MAANLMNTSVTRSTVDQPASIISKSDGSPQHPSGKQYIHFTAKTAPEENRAPFKYTADREAGQSPQRPTWQAFAHALGIDPQSPQAIVAGIDRLYHGPITALQWCKKIGPKGEHEWIPQGRAINVATLKHEGGIFWRPACPGGHVDRAFTGSHLVFYEIDDLPLDEQWVAIDRLAQQTGLKPAAVVFSGGKSLHCFYRLDRALAADAWRRLMRKLAIAQSSDPAIVSLSRQMRFPGGQRYRKPENAPGYWIEQSIERLDGTAIYSPEQFETALDGLGLWPHGISDERWRLWKRQRAEHGHNAKALRSPDSELFPPRVASPQPTAIAYDGQSIPLEKCLSRAERAWLNEGAAAGERNQNGYILGRSLIGTAEWLIARGYRVAGDPESLLMEYCQRSGLSDREAAQLWRSCGRGVARPSLNDEALETCIAAWQRRGEMLARNRAKGVGFAPKPPAPTPPVPTAPYEIACLDKETEEITSVWAYAYEPITPDAKTLAIARWEPHNRAGNRAIIFDPLQPPTRQEWLDLGCPKLLYWADDRLIVWRAALAITPNELDTSAAGGGKSTTGGIFAQNWQATANEQWDGQDDRPRAILLDPDHRNPSAATTAELLDFPSKHPGLTTGSMGAIRVAKPGDQLIEPASCHHARSFAAAAALGYPLSPGADCSLCHACPMAIITTKGEGEDKEVSIDCPYMKSVREAKESEKGWRAHPACAPTKCGDLLIVDEIDRTLPTTKTQSYSAATIERELSKLDRFNPAAHEAVRPLAMALLGAIDAAKHNRHGLHDLAARRQLPTVKDLWPLIVAHCRAIANIADDYDPWKAPPAPSLRVWVGEGDHPNDVIGGIGDDAYDPAKALAAIESQVIAKGLGAIAAILLGQSRGAISIDGWQGVTITRRNRSQVIAPPIKVGKPGNKPRPTGCEVLAIDATASRLGMALDHSIRLDQLIEVAAMPSAFAGKLAIHFCCDAGSFGHQRDGGEFGAATRAANFARAVSDRHGAASTGVIDFKAFLGGYSVGAIGAHFVDGRKSNAFEQCEALAIIGKPTPNLGAKAAEWLAMTGERIADPGQLEGRYGAWVRRAIVNEDIQEAARLRAQWAASEKHLYFLGNYSQREQAAIARAFPGAAVSVEGVATICPAAATKGEQTKRTIVRAAWQLAKIRGRVNVRALAGEVGQSIGSIHKHLKALPCGGSIQLEQCLLFLLEALKRKSEHPPAIPEGAEWLLESLPELASDFASGKFAAAEVVSAIEEVAQFYSPQAFGAILERLEPIVLARLATALASSRPPTAHPTPIPIAV